MSEAGQTTQRFPVEYFDGVNSTVQSTLAKRTEIHHSENANSPEIGVLQKRGGQVVQGVTTGDTEFVGAFPTHSLFFFNSDEVNNEVHRVTTVGADTSIYRLNTSNQWEKLSDADAQGLTPVNMDTINVDGKMYLVNGEDANRYIDSDGVTVIDSTAAGNLFNSPDANKIVYYKNRIHLADFTKSGVRYPTTIVRSSYPLGIIALVDGDQPVGITDLRVTDSKYFYAGAGVNTYDIYRGGTFVETITVTGVNETSVNINATANAILSSDEVWIGGTFAGEKQFRWVNNPSTTGLDVKQYDTFKLTGGDNSPITMFETIGNTLMIGNKHNLATWDDYTLTNLDLGIGCVSNRATTKLLGTLYFMDYSGVYGTTGGLPTLLSRKVDRYISGATRAGLESSVAGIKGLSVFFTIGDVTLYQEDGSVEKELNKVALEYSVADQNWYVHTNIDYSDLLNFTDKNGVERLWGANRISAVNYPVASLLEGNTDFEDEIFMRVDTQEIQLMKEFETSGIPINIVTEIDRGSQMQVYVSLDRERYFELSGTAKKGVSRLKVHRPGKVENTPPHCRRIRVSYRDSSKQLVRLKQFAINYLPTTVDEQHE